MLLPRITLLVATVLVLLALAGAAVLASVHPAGQHVDPVHRQLVCGYGQAPPCE